MNTRGGSSIKSVIAVAVVVGIILLLFGMIFAPISNGPAKARQVSCLSNMSQLAKAFKMYADDNNSHYPDGCRLEDLGSSHKANVNWVWFQGTRREKGAYTYNNPPVPTWRIAPEKGSMWRYTNKSYKLFICPAGKRAYDRKSTTLGAFDLSYTMNASLAGLGPTSQRRATYTDNDVYRPTRTVLLSEAWNCTHIASFRGRGDAAPPYDGVLRWWQAEPVGRHLDGGNVVFCDGHAKWVNLHKQHDILYRIDGVADSRQFACPKWK